MKKHIRILLVALVVLPTLNSQLSTALAQTTAITYQGRLNDGANPANGNYDLTFNVCDAFTNGSVVGGPLTNSATAVSNGLFTVTLDFGVGVFTGPDRWLEIAVCSNGVDSFITLAPRQRFTPAPHAIFANTASNLLGTLPAAQLAGTYSSAVTLDNPGNQVSGAFAGDGSGVTNVNAAQLGGLSSAGFWQLSGNSGTASGNYLGTADNRALELRVNGVRALRLEPAGAGNGPNVIGGYSGNSVGSGVASATIGGGGGSGSQNLTAASWSTIGGGGQNTIQSNSDGSTISGGNGNFIQTSVVGVTIAGGQNNTVWTNSRNSVIGGGNNNFLLGVGATIAGGGNNNIGPGGYSAIGGGANNTIQANYGAIPGGNSNVVSGNLSFAAGYNAQANHQGSFVWADNSSDAPFADSAGRQFLIRAGNGVGINTTNPAGAALSVNGKITSPMWQATNVLNTVGPLSKTNPFTSGGGTLVIVASGSGYSTTGGAIGMNILLDANVIDSCQIMASQTNVHLAFVPKTIVKKPVAAGSHTVALQALAGTTTDATDNYNVTILELPF